MSLDLSSLFEGGVWEQLGIEDESLIPLSFLRRVRSRFRRKVLDRATHFALEGTARQAKFAVRLIAYSKKADELAPDLAEVSSAIPTSPLRSSKLTDFVPSLVC